MRQLNKTSKRKQPNYQPNEDLLIKECVAKSPQNLSHAFKEAEKMLKNRTFYAIATRWHNVLKYQEVIYTVTSDKVQTSNTKTELPNATQQTKSLIQRIEDRVEDRVVEELVRQLLKKLE